MEQERLQLNIDDDLLQRNINAYLTKQYDSQITRVEADAKSVTIQGNYFGKGKAMLCEIAPWENLTLIKKFNFGEKVTQRSFSIKIDRYVYRDGFFYDRSLSKWVLVRPGNKKDKIISHARYVDYIQPKQAMSAPVLVSRKGLSYVNANKYVPDFDDLQLGVCSVNLPLTEFVCLDPLPNTIPHAYGGKTYYMSKKAVDFYDRTIMAATQRNMIVAALVLVLPSSNTASKWADPKAGSLLLNKNCTYSAIQAMPNMTSAEAVNCYAAGMDFLASRYCRSDNAYGRVHHWVIHNEVDAGTLWTNMGKDRPMSVYMDTYYKSLRLCYQIAREYDAYSEVLASFTHSWTAAVNDYPTLDMIKELQSYAIEGDFHWGLAYHPYPEDLTEPKTCNDVYPTFNMNTPRITFKNLEVLDAWIKKPENKYMGTQKRTLWLAENGTNSKTYEGQDLQEQAAGLAYAWEKFKVLDGIDAFLYHAWIDNRCEFGLRIGLRRFDNDETDPGGRKPIWFVYQAAGTDQEDAVFDPYKSIIGISDWAEIMQEVEDK
ncbi:MAG: hypothetical protein EZS26_004080 [Candidatus Ordinivivax streblomastigis]|uniref:DUF5722 domain-containing protein n=1 Tax=Candidatus Ordinivivax streblomastigis TaxID=2540710 RepID=A0A5M8NT45_9BACT|nr:MAG: hypothetical protein EZS26_004080 [Candidatus Ordinivivax streblomastigis]